MRRAANVRPLSGDGPTWAGRLLPTVEVERMKVLVVDNDPICRGRVQRNPSFPGVEYATLLIVRSLTKDRRPQLVSR
jgi:hypothetical protein